MLADITLDTGIAARGARAPQPIGATAALAAGSGARPEPGKAAVGAAEGKADFGAHVQLTGTAHVQAAETQSGAQAGQATDAAPAATHLPNPQLTVDPSTARVVYDYYNDTGLLTNSIPSPQQLQAYRVAAAAGGGDVPGHDG